MAAWRTFLPVLLVVFLSGSLAVFPARAQAPASLVVAISECPPFVMKDRAGKLTGISIDLWGLVARKMGVAYTYREYAWSDMLAAVEAGQVDVAISCITISASREEVMDFSHSFYHAELTAAVRKTTTFDSLRAITSDWRTAVAFAGMLLFSFLTGGTMWSLERKNNPQAHPKQGKLATFIDIVLFSITFITRGTKEYSAYHSQAARILAAVGTFASALNLTAITAVLASVLTTTTLQGHIETPVDLKNIRVATFQDGIGMDYLNANQLRFVTLENASDMDALNMLAENQFDALIGDEPTFQYNVKIAQAEGRLTNIQIMPWRMQRQEYGIAMPSGSPLREPMNRALLEILTSPAWQAIQDAYLKY